MLKVFLLIFNPAAAWGKIAQAQRGFLYITIIQLLPLILIGGYLEGWGLEAHGKWQPRFQFFKTFPREDVISFEVIQFFLMLATVLISALLIYKIGLTFQERLTFLQVFTTVAYAFSPMFLVHILDASAMMNPAVTWLLGIALAIWVLYQGIPQVMRPDPTHAFGIYFSSLIVIVLTTGLARLITGMYLLGYMDFQHSWLSRKIIQYFGH